MHKKQSPVLELTKAKIRSKILARLKKQKEEERKRKSKVIAEKLFRLDRIKKAKTIMFYVNLADEVSTEEMIEKALLLGKTVVIPKCVKRTRKLIPYKLGCSKHLIIGPYGVREPVSRVRVPLFKLDAVIVPGLAFDKKGNRLGRGKGYYDRFLSRLPKKTYRLGLAFRQQILSSLPLAPHDRAVDKVLFA
jgi:5-formyltetrahydrofolate cyclo-ligase